MRATADSSPLPHLVAERPIYDALGTADSSPLPTPQSFPYPGGGGLNNGRTGKHPDADSYPLPSDALRGAANPGT